MTNPKFNLTRRRGLQLAGATLLGSTVGLPAFAQEFPSDTISFICAFPAGSGADVLVRYFAQGVSEVAGVTVIVENKAGAAGNIAAEYTARADPDGYTVYVHAGSSTAMNYHLWTNPPIDPRTDLRGVAAINQQPFYIVVGADSPHQTIDDLIAYLREAGEDASYATSATSGRVLGAAFTNALGVSPVEVQYRTGPDALPDIMSLAVDFAVSDPVSTMINAREGRTRTLATGAGSRMQVAPDIPSLTESGLDIAQVGWWGAWVPAETPDDIVNRLNALFAEVLERQETQEFLASMGGDTWIATPAEVDAMMVQTVDEAEALVELADLPRN
ncbi:Bug family tripartite tricarboxylate transporter substrate binding protein [Pararhodobacter marinus]|uniref:Bug family tripartite tricarboxylate transporter substrate binding protein n=1 Tax=Pararhodobacter marinus TaxID=2184063 RepID=UPI0035198990